MTRTCQKLDPYNPSISGLLTNLENSRGQLSVASVQGQIRELEAAVRANPSDFQKALDLALRYYQLQLNDRAIAMLEGILGNPNMDIGVAFAVASTYAKANDLERVENTLELIVKKFPGQPDGWYNLASVQVARGKQSEALQNLKRALEISDAARARNSANHDWRADVDKDPRFLPLHNLPEFKALVAHP